MSELVAKQLGIKPVNDIIEKMVYHQIANPSKDLPNLMVINGKTVRNEMKHTIPNDYSKDFTKYSFCCCR